MTENGTSKVPMTAAVVARSTPRGSTTPREWIRGVLFVVIFTAAVVGLSIWALFAFVFRCACATPA